MALTSDPFDATELAAFISESWTPLVNEAFFAKTVFANFCTDLSSYAADGSDIFHIPDVFTNVTTAQTQSTQGAEVTTAAPAATDVTLTVNTHKYVANLIGYKDLVQIAKQYDINAVYTKQAADVLADALEADLAALWSSLTTNSVGDTATVLADVEVRQAIEKLATLNYNLEECAFFLHPLTQNSGYKIFSNWLGNLYEITRRKASATVNDLTRRLLNWRCESLNFMAT